MAKWAGAVKTNDFQKLFSWHLPAVAKKCPMAANAYHVTGTYTCAQVREKTGQHEVWDASWDAIVFANSPDEAQKFFGDALCQLREGENPKETTIRKTSVAPIVDRLLTESENVPLKWEKILDQANSLVQSTSVDDFEQGYWVDVNAVVPSNQISFSLGTIESNMPEEVRSGLNWSGNNQFFFLLKVLPLPQPPPIPAYEQEVEAEDVETERPEESGTGEIDEWNVIWPETVAVIQARNSVAAAWLWRRYAANTQWSNHAIQIAPLCTTIGETG